MWRLLVACVCAGLGLGCRTPAPAVPHESLDATLWTSTSAEYRAAARQAWRIARERLDAALAEPGAGWSAVPEQADGAGLPPAVILDIDEAALDNAAFQAWLAREDRTFDRENWEAWVREARAPAVPGAVAFARYAASRGVTVFYVSNRRYRLEDATRRNLEQRGFPVDPDGSNILSRDEGAGWEGDKASRRAFVAADYRVLLVVGDDLNDFVSGSHADPASRRALAERYGDWWGTRWILIPNPVYGSWERSLYDFESELPREEKLRRKREALPDGR